MSAPEAPVPREAPTSTQGFGELRAQLSEWRAGIERRLPPWWSRGLAGALVVIGILLPFLFANNSGFMNATIIALAFAVMSLGLNVVVGFAGLLDLGYVAFTPSAPIRWGGSGPTSSSTRTCTSGYTVSPPPRRVST